MHTVTPQLLFVYGTLMHPPVFEAVAGRPAGKMTKARLPGFQRSALEGVVFPGIVPDVNSSTDGLLVQVDEHAVSLLDAFEGSWYERVAVTVEPEDGQPVTAGVYVLSNSVEHLVTGMPWDLEKFLAADLHSFMNG